MFELEIYPTLIDEKGNNIDSIAIQSYFASLKPMTEQKALVLLLTSNTVEDIIVLCIKFV